MTREDGVLIFENLMVAGTEIKAFGEPLSIPKPAEQFVAANAAGSLRAVLSFEEVEAIGKASGASLRAAFSKA